MSHDRVFFCLHQGCLDNVGSWLFTNYAIILGICLGVAVIEVCCMSSGRHEQYAFVLLRNGGVFIINEGYIVQWNVTLQFFVEQITNFHFDLSAFFSHSTAPWYDTFYGPLQECTPRRVHQSAKVLRRKHGHSHTNVFSPFLFSWNNRSPSFSTVYSVFSKDKL